MTISFPFDPDTGEFKPGFSYDPASGEWKEDPSAPQRVFPKTDAEGNLIKNDEGKISYRVILDDVTQKNLGFGDIQSDDPDNPANPIPLGSNIDVQAHVTALDNRTGDSNIEKCNSLFAGYVDPDDPDNPDNMPSSPTEAHITNFRHLENLSKLDGSSTPITAKLDDDICWKPSDPSNPAPCEKSFTEGVQAIRDEYAIPSSGDPAYTPVSLNNTDFDGDNHVIKNLVIDQPDGNGNAGVFGTLTGDNAIKNVTLENTDITTDATKAGALILSRRINLESRSVLHKASLKKGSHNSRTVLELFQTGADIAFQFLLRPWGSFGSRVPFDIAVKQFVRVVFCA